MAEISAMGEIITCGSLIVPKSCDIFLTWLLQVSSGKRHQLQAEANKIQVSSSEASPFQAKLQIAHTIHRYKYQDMMRSNGYVARTKAGLEQREYDRRPRNFNFRRFFALSRITLPKIRHVSRSSSTRVKGQLRFRCTTVHSPCTKIGLGLIFTHILSSHIFYDL